LYTRFKVLTSSQQYRRPAKNIIIFLSGLGRVKNMLKKFRIKFHQFAYSKKLAKRKKETKKKETKKETQAP
jgi:hypothetical protein